MGKVLMRKTVFDNKSGYHKAGEIVTLSADVERHYLANNFGTKVEDQPEVIAPIVEAVEVETKEQKMIYGHVGHKAKKNAANKD